MIMSGQEDKMIKQSVRNALRAGVCPSNQAKTTQGKLPFYVIANQITVFLGT
jgi:hypothetical protein